MSKKRVTYQRAHEQQEREDEIIYADDANIISMCDTTQQLTRRLQSYILVTEQEI